MPTPKESSKPKARSNSHRPIAIDLFSGAGGMALGVEQAGFDVACAVEVDPVHAAVHAYNFPGCSMMVRDAAACTGEQIRAAAGLSATDGIALVTGGPPCQGFSVMGKNLADDPRSSLIDEFARLVSELKPDYFIFENVKGLTMGRNKDVLAGLIDKLKAAGYRVNEPEVLNAVNYAVPQHRERLILMGVRYGLRMSDYPDHRLHKPTVAEAIGDLPDIDGFDELIEGDEVRHALAKPTSRHQKEMRNFNGMGWHYGIRREWDRGLMTCSVRTNHKQAIRDRFHSVPRGTVDPISRFYRLKADGVSCTLRAGTDASRGAHTSPRPIHHRRARCISVREMARLHGFPDWFRLHSTKWHGARQVGNAVPPPLARAVALEIMVALGVQPSRPIEAIELGDTALLRMNATQAAKYWGGKE